MVKSVKVLKYLSCFFLLVWQNFPTQIPSLYKKRWLAYWLNLFHFFLRLEIKKNTIFSQFCRGWEKNLYFLKDILQNEIAMSSNIKTVELLAIRLCHNPFHTPRIAWKWKTQYIYLQFLVIYSQYYCKILT